MSGQLLFILQPCPVEERIQLSEMVKSRKNLTVVYVPEFVNETISLMKRCLPGMDRLLFIGISDTLVFRIKPG
mgnify:CR=1 FL=1